MGGRTLTNILLAIIAGCLLFGGGAMLGGLHVAFWIGIVLLVLFAIIWCIAKYIRSMADEMCKEKTITGKAIVPALYIGLVGIFVSALRAIYLMLEQGSWNIRSAVEKLIVEPWGAPIILFLMCGFAWSLAAGIGKMMKSFFSSEKAAHRIDIAGRFLSAWVLLPFYLAIRQYQRASASGDEPISAAAVALMFGLFIWSSTVGIVLAFSLAAFQNFHRS